MSGATGGANRSANFLIQSSGHSNVGTVFLAERANFSIKIFSKTQLGKKHFEKIKKAGGRQQTKVIYLSLPLAPEEKRRKRRDTPPCTAKTG